MLIGGEEAECKVNKGIIRKRLRQCEKQNDTGLRACAIHNDPCTKTRVKSPQLRVREGLAGVND